MEMASDVLRANAYQKGQVARGMYNIIEMLAFA